MCSRAQCLDVGDRHFSPFNAEVICTGCAGVVTHGCIGLTECMAYPCGCVDKEVIGL